VGAKKEPVVDGEAAWFDADVCLPRAGRQMTTQIHKLSTDLKMECQHGSAALMEFERDAHASEFAMEMDVLKNRVHAVKLVLGNVGESVDVTAEKLRNYIEQFSAFSGRSATSEIRTQSASRARAGPCPGFQHLAALSFLQQKANELKKQSTTEVQALTTVEQVAEMTDSYEKHVKATNELLKSIKSARAELFQARLDHASLAARAEMAQKKATAKREKMFSSVEAAESKKAKLASVGAGGAANAVGSAKVLDSLTRARSLAFNLPQLMSSERAMWMFDGPSSCRMRK
jgi:chromosome segregation ATPase